MEKNEFQQIAEKISNGTATEKEVALYNYYYNQFQEETEWDNEHLGEKHHTEKELHARITKNLSGYTGQVRPFPYLKIAAAIALIAVSVVFFFRNEKEEPLLAHSEDKRFEQDVNPGTNKAVLTLSDGKVLNLDESQNGILADQGNARVKKLENGEIEYTAGNNVPIPSDKEIFNTITIPRGGQYQLTLPDGTKVWLNASSSLKFPVSFIGDTRVVELEGEAYFEVAKAYRKSNSGKSQKLSFIVKTPSQKIEVLGTHFNVNAYANESIIKTTLMEGSVKVSATKTGFSKILKPGQQSQLAKTGSISLTEDIDTEEIMAWKNGMFYFNNTDMETIMKQLSRWYDVEIDIDDFPQKRFNGILSRNVKLSQVLKMMEKTSGLKFKIDERRVFML